MLEGIVSTICRAELIALPAIFILQQICLSVVGDLASKFAQHLFRDNKLLYLSGALINPVNPGVAEEALGFVLL